MLPKQLLPLTVFLLCLYFGTASGQGTVRGKISDEAGEPVVGASIVLKNNLTYGTMSDFDGNFSLVIKDSLPVEIRISYISFKTIEAVVNPKNGQVLVKNFTLVAEGQEIEAVEIEAKISRENNVYMEQMKTKSASTIDYISSETIKKTGDSYVAAAVARVAGVSTTSEGIVTVRGIGDRYVKTTLNNAVIPTLDPISNNLKLDIFPTSLIDNVVLSKTARPDYPGDWAGAYISVLTKDYPETLNIVAETSIGYNTQSTFKDFLTSEKSSTDWLGYDNDFRDYDHSQFNNVIASPNQYTELVALGLGPYYQSLGVTTPWAAGTSAGETYFKLGLVQLGLLGAAQFDDPTAVASAKAAYNNGNFKNTAFLSINQKGVETGQSMPNNWNTFYETAPLDFAQSFSIGNQTTMFGKPLGFITGFRYASQYRTDPNAKSERAVVDVNGVSSLGTYSEQVRSVETHGWSALLNLNYKLNNNNSVGFLFMPNQTGNNKVRNGTDYGTNQSYTSTLSKEQFYESRRQLIYQLKSEHYLTKPKTKVEFNASFTEGDSKAPDFKKLTYFDNQGQYIIDIKEADTYRYYQYLSENIIDTRITAEFPLSEKPGLSRKFKFGGGYQKNDRESEQFSYAVIYNGGGDLIIDNNDIEAYYDHSSFGFTTDTNGVVTIDKYYERDENPANHIIGYNEVLSGFVMADYNFSFALRATGGLRIEKANIFTDVYQYDKLGYKANDPRRQFVTDVFTVNPGTLNEVSILPSIGIIYNINRSQETPFNLRLNYSKSVARPSIRELSDAIVYDYELQDYLFGNSALKPVKIDNYDIRLERYFKSRDNVSISLFYKNFIDHIELVKNFQGYSWQNVEESYVAGIELEGRKKLLRNLEFIGNITLVKSETNYIQYQLVVLDGIKNYIPVDTLKRAMFGQAPYVFNAILNYNLDSLGLSISASYNLQGEKLVVTSIDGNPDIYEQPRHILDMKVSKKIGKYFSLSLKAQNILNTPVKWQYDYSDKEINWDNYKYGTTYTLGLTYKLSK